MSGVVTFNPAAFVAQYPVFAAYNTASPNGLQNYFNMTTPFLNNTVNSRVSDVVLRAQLLNMLVAHLAQLDGVLTPEGQGSTAQQVGRISDATEGSVKASFAMPGATANAAWYLQTQYGAMFWAATAPIRTMRYVRPCRWGWR